MGSPLGVLFANAYMDHVETETLTNHQKPRIYARFVDDIFITIKDKSEATALANALQGNSCLNFTVEHSENKTLPFLDILVTQNGQNFKTKVYTKATNAGRCLNARGECPVAYQRSVVDAYVKRAIKYCSTWKDTHEEIERIKQLLTNNGYQDKLIQDVINRRMNKFYENTEREDDKSKNIVIYHQIGYSARFEDEKKILSSIIKRGTTPITPYEKITPRIYSKPNTTAAIIIKNNTTQPEKKEEKTNVVYKFTCSEEACQSPQRTYIGHTSTALRRRLQAHRNNGAIFQHYTEKHDRKPSLNELVENTEILHTEQNYHKRIIAEASYILLHRPNMNIQLEAEKSLPSCRKIMQRNTSMQNEEENNNNNVRPRGTQGRISHQNRADHG